MGSKGSPTTTQTNQTYSANPATQAAATQALSAAQTAAASPFSMPVAPVAGFNPTQTQAFGEVGAAQGQAQPYYNQAATDFSAGSTPISQAQINSYYNPMASNVTAQLQNIYGEQNAQNQGNLTAQAGGVGADRIAVGMGDLANQQGLASGQIYSQLYQQALTAAQQQQQQTVQAGSNMANLGTTAQNTALQGAGALGSAGLQQQQQTQSELNAPYQNQLAQIAYQFQTPQYLAGIAGGLAPALGGTTNGVQVTTPPQPTALSQILGLGTAGAGIYGALGGSGTSASSPSYGGGSATSGDVQSTSANPGSPLLSASDFGVGYAEGGGVEDSGPAIPGVNLPKVGGFTPIPSTSLPMGGGHSGPLTGGINTAPAQAASGSGGNSASNTASEIASAVKIASMFAKRGGKIGHYDDGGDVSQPNLPGPKFDPSRPINAPAPIGAPWPFNSARTVMGGDGTMVPYKTPDATVTDPPVTTENGKTPFPKTDPRKTGMVKVASQHTNHTPSGGAGTTDASVYASPDAGMPYPNATQKDWGQNLATSPWMALVKAGAAMATTPGPLGVSIGKGLQAGAAGLDLQRKELRSEQELNDKAQELYQTAKTHLDKYNKMTPYEQATVALKNKELDQADSPTLGGKPVLTPQNIAKYIGIISSDPASVTMTAEQKQQRAIAMIRAQSGGPGAVGPGTSPQTAIPLGNGTTPEPGKWYIGPSGKPQQWNG